MKNISHLKFMMPLAVAVISLTALSACEERKNPLLEKHPEQLRAYLYDNADADVLACAPLWADPRTAPPISLKECKKTAKALADEINYQGFAEKVTPDDLNLPIVWKDIHDHAVDMAERKADIKRRLAEKPEPTNNRLLKY